MIFWVIKHGRKVAKFDCADISIKQLIQLHKLGYAFEPACNELMLLANQAGSSPVGATQQSVK